MLDQAPMQRQGHVYHAEPCTRRRQWPLGAEQACKEILPLELHMVRQAAVIWAYASHLAAVSNVHATKSSTRRERAVIVVSASSCHSPILFAKTRNTGRSPIFAGRAQGLLVLVHVPHVANTVSTYTCTSMYCVQNFALPPTTGTLPIRSLLHVVGTYMLQ